MGSLTTIEFRGDTLFAVERDDGVFVAVKPITERLGLAWNKQLERLKRDPLLSEGVTVMGIPSPGGTQETTCLALRYLNGWLFGISVNHVKPEMRERVLAYQRECYDVLADHFLGPRAAARPIRMPEVGADADIRVREHQLETIAEARRIYGKVEARKLWQGYGFPDLALPPSAAKEELERTFLGDVVARTLQTIAEAYGTWSGTPAQLLAEMEVTAYPLDKKNGRWPRDAQAIGTAIARVKPLLAHRGIAVERKHSGIRTITLRLIEA